MKSVLNILGIKSMTDVNKIRRAVSNNEGVIACQITKDKGQVSIVYDSNCIMLADIEESIEDLGYTIL